MKPRRLRPATAPSLFALFAVVALLSACATTAAAHCCHDERGLGAAAQSELRRGVHGLEGRRLGDDFERDDHDSRFDRTGSLNGSGLGGLRGDSIGNYGAGSLGQRGPGGLGALQGNSIFTDPPRPR